MGEGDTPEPASPPEAFFRWWSIPRGCLAIVDKLPRVFAGEFREYAYQRCGTRIRLRYGICLYAYASVVSLYILPLSLPRPPAPPPFASMSLRGVLYANKYKHTFGTLDSADKMQASGGARVG